MDAAPTFTWSMVKASRPTEVRLERAALIHAAEGAMRLEADRARWSLLPQQAALVAASRPVTVSVPVRVRALWVHFDAEMVPDLTQALSVFDVPPLAAAVIDAIGTGEPDLAPGAARRLRHVLADVAQVAAARPSPCVLPAPESPALARAMALADAQLETLPAFGEIARQTGQSTRSLTRRAAEELGMSWRDLIRRMRMIRAVEALATTDAPVAEIAVLVGYSALSGFNDAFRDFTGLSPTAFRTQGRPLV